MLKMEHEYEMKLSQSKADAVAAQHESQMIKLASRNELLELKLEMANLKVSSQ